MIIKVDGMTCQHCASNVKRAIEGVCKPDSVEDNLDTGQVAVYPEPAGGEAQLPQHPLAGIHPLELLQCEPLQP